ncbi:YqhR family membrane protein [Gracilibacillus alcaliphilus]|uniref:YqhR family membrane protein n=1 Tax=Gracilibacillus alcaliphilus TaxID=1401441 RepID=UPI00195D7E77|nr:YqhR family membrane protein [Gracilibacillus alcaliphilus]MBM7675049.1 xanthine/uracil permease [Gracilibacillus alcaliphilus]
MRRVQHKGQGKDKDKLALKTLSTGFFGGLIWGSVAAIAGFLNFTSVTPKSFFLRSWLVVEWTDKWIGEVISILLLGIVSIIWAFIYYAVLKKFEGVFPGVVTGVVLWFIVFGLLQALFHNIKPFYQLDSDTILTTVCLFVLYSVFVGYSISFAYHQHINEKN